MTMRTLVLSLTLVTAARGKEDPCTPSVSVISATWSGAGHGGCSHSQHTLSTKELAGGAVQVNCECPDPKNGKK